jgi:hypothetical protein
MVILSLDGRPEDEKRESVSYRNAIGILKMMSSHNDGIRSNLTASCCTSAKSDIPAYNTIASPLTLSAQQSFKDKL